MRSLKWSISHAVFVTEIDDEHKEIFEAVANLQKALARRLPPLDIRKRAEQLTSCIVEHFAHEERLMRAGRYGSLRWHQRSHRCARRRVGQFVARIEQGDTTAGLELVEYLISWLPDHAGVADRMMGAFLRNEQRFMWKVTLRAGTKPLEACVWVDTKGGVFDPGNERERL